MLIYVIANAISLLGLAGPITPSKVRFCTDLLPYVNCCSLYANVAPTTTFLPFSSIKFQPSISKSYLQSKLFQLSCFKFSKSKISNFHLKQNFLNLNFYKFDIANLPKFKILNRRQLNILYTREPNFTFNYFRI